MKVKAVVSVVAPLCFILLIASSFVFISTAPPNTTIQQPSLPVPLALNVKLADGEHWIYIIIWDGYVKGQCGWGLYASYLAVPYQNQSEPIKVNSSDYWWVVDPWLIFMFKGSCSYKITWHFQYPNGTSYVDEGQCNWVKQTCPFPMLVLNYTYYVPCHGNCSGGYYWSQIYGDNDKGNIVSELQGNKTAYWSAFIGACTINGFSVNCTPITLLGNKAFYNPGHDLQINVTIFPSQT